MFIQLAEISDVALLVELMVHWMETFLPKVHGIPHECFTNNMVLRMMSIFFQHSHSIMI